MSLYAAIAEHVCEERAPDIDPAPFRAWLSAIDQGSDADFAAIDDALDRFIGRYRENEHATDKSR